MESKQTSVQQVVRVAVAIGGVLLVLAAVVQELRRPRAERAWHGRLLGVIPYDFRPPTFARVRAAWWNPDSDRLFTDRAFGVGWGLNLPVLFDRVRAFAEPG